MQYRQFGTKDIEVSALAIDASNLHTINKPDGEIVIDDKKVIKNIRMALDKGVDLIDVSLAAKREQSEITVGKALTDGYETSAQIMAGISLDIIETREDFLRLLDEKLERFGVDCIDFLTIEGLDSRTWNDIFLEFGIHDNLMHAIKEGKIRYYGFYFNGNMDFFITIVNNYKWDYCYLDIGANVIGDDYCMKLEGMQYAHSRGLAVVIKDPLMGGRMVSTTPRIEEILGKNKKPMEWAVDFLLNREDVTVISLNMDDDKAITQAVEYVSRTHIGMLKENELAKLEKAREVFYKTALIGCIRCGKCLPCPAGINIPKVFSVYNMIIPKGFDIAQKLYSDIEIVADSCRHCHMCEKMCPNKLNISEHMNTIRLTLNKK